MTEETPNMHEGHEASCLCCVHMRLGFDPGWSSYTPGEGPMLVCSKGRFAETGNMREVHEIARHCDVFHGREP